MYLRALFRSVFLCFNSSFARHCNSPYISSFISLVCEIISASFLPCFHYRDGETESQKISVTSPRLVEAAGEEGLVQRLSTFKKGWGFFFQNNILTQFSENLLQINIQRCLRNTEWASVTGQKNGHQIYSRNAIFNILEQGWLK